MNKISNNTYLRVSLITLAALSMLFSTFHFQVQIGNAQSNTDNTTGIFSTLTPKQIQQLAANRTSFDGAIKQRIAAMNAARIPVNYTAFNSPDVLKSINICTSALAKVFGQSLCDLAMATVYELCQAIPNQLSYCVMPAINSYIKDRNMVDGQTDKLAWQTFLHGKEIAANPYGISDNSTATITNTTALGPTQTPTQGGDSILMKVELDATGRVTNFQLTASNATGICISNNCQFSIENADFRHNTATGGYVFEGLLKSTVTQGDVKTSKFINMRVDLDKTGSVERPGKTTEMLEGEIDFGKNTYSPDFKYKVVNGTLETDPHLTILNLQGNRE